MGLVCVPPGCGFEWSNLFRLSAVSLLLLLLTFRYYQSTESLSKAQGSLKCCAVVFQVLKEPADGEQAESKVAVMAR